MAQPERSRKSQESSKTPKGLRSPTFQQLIQGDAAWQFSTSPTPPKSQDQEEDFSPYNNNRKSMFTKVKEKAKKLRQSLSMKKRQENDQNHDSSHGNNTPSWGVSLEDDEDDDEVDEDPEYFGAPMYESELAPEALKESARQHPRANPVFSHNHVLPTPSCNKHQDEQNQQKDKDHTKAAAAAAVPDATQNRIYSKIADLTITVPDHKNRTQTDQKNHEHFATGDMNSDIGEHISPQKWDKGVSVKEYFMNKLEPGEDDKALSQVISEAISPTKKPSSELGVVEKVREAVTSFLRHDQESPSLSSPNKPQPYFYEATYSPSKNQSISPSAGATNRNKVFSPTSTNSNSNSTSSPSALTSLAMKIAGSSSKSSNTELTSPRAISKKEKPYVPISLSSSCVEDPPKQAFKAHNPVFTERKSTAPANSVSSSIRANTTSATLSHRTHTANASSSGQQSKVTIKALNSLTNTSTPASAPSKTGLQQAPTFVFSSRPNASSSSTAMSRSKSLSAHMPVPNGATSSPLIPVSTNAQGAAEEQAHGRILQTN